MQSCFKLIDKERCAMLQREQEWSRQGDKLLRPRRLIQFEIKLHRRKWFLLCSVLPVVRLEGESGEFARQELLPHLIRDSRRNQLGCGIRGEFMCPDSINSNICLLGQF